MALEGYSIGIQKLDEMIGPVPPGTNILIIGPPMCSKDSVIMRMATHAFLNEEALIFVNTNIPGEKLLELLRTVDGFDEERIGIVDCISRSLGVMTPETDIVQMASSPVDLTGIGVRISKYFEQFYMRKGIKKIRLIMDSLSTILMYSNIKTVYRFLHVFTGRIRSADALGIFGIESGMHDEQTLSTLKQLFDGVIEFKLVEGEKEYIRAVGLTPKPTDWITLDEEVGGD